MKTLALASITLTLVGLGLTPAPQVEDAVDSDVKLVAASTYEAKLRTAVRKLPVKSEVNKDYSRESYKHWSDLDKDSCDTRVEVLLSESKTKLSSASCDVTGGKWVSYFDGQTTRDASSFDIDHLVPLAEAHGSGAHAWDANTKERYANDLGDKRSLVAVSASSNRSKSDRDVAEWLPPKASAKCRYVKEWVAVKVRWSLTVDQAEKSALRRIAGECKNVTVKVKLASIKKDSGGSTGGSGTGTPSGLKVRTIQYDPAGTDTLNGEWVKFKNITKKPLKLSGWRIQDEAGASHTFTSGRVRPGKTVLLYSGSGTQQARKHYAGRGQSWWNNSGDSFKLYSPTGKLKQKGSYEGSGDGGAANFS